VATLRTVYNNFKEVSFSKRVNRRHTLARTDTGSDHGS